MSINCDDKNVRYKIVCFILHTVLLMIILLLIIAIIYYHYIKQKCIYALTIQNWKIMNSEKFVLKIVLVIVSMTIKFDDFDFDNILIDEK